MRSISGFPFEVRISVDLGRVAAGTRLEWLVSFEPGGLLRPAGPLLVAIYKRVLAKDLENLKAMMETGAL